MKKHTKILFVTLFGLLLCGSRPADMFIPFFSEGLPTGSTQSLLWFSDVNGKIIRFDFHGFNNRELIETLAFLAKIKVVFDEFPDNVISGSMKDKEPMEAIRFLVSLRDLVITELPDSSYHIGPKAVPSSGTPPSR